MPRHHAYPGVQSARSARDSVSHFWREYRGKERSAHGFSLVEVTLALGIVAFVMISLIGVIPIGLSSATSSAEQTLRTHIIKQVASDLSMLPYNDLPAYINIVQYYNQEGHRVDKATDGTFQATLKVASPSYPSSSELVNLNKRMERVIVSTRRIGAPATQEKRTALTIANSGF